MIPWATPSLCAPFPTSSRVLRKVRNIVTGKQPAQTLAMCKRMTPQKRRLKWEQNWERNCPNLVPRYATIARHLNVLKPTCKGTEFSWYFLPKRVKHVTEHSLAVYSWKNSTLLKCIVAPKVLIVSEYPNNVFWQIYCIILIFCTTIESKQSIAISSHTIYSRPVLQFALPLEMKPSRQGTFVP